MIEGLLNRKEYLIHRVSNDDMINHIPGNSGRFEYAPYQIIDQKFMDPKSGHDNLIIFGETGIGKCVEGNSIVEIEDVGKITIRKLFESILRGEFLEKKLSLKNPEEKLSLEQLLGNEEEKFFDIGGNVSVYVGSHGFSKIVKIFMQKYKNGKLIKISTKNGKSLTATPAHRVATLMEGVIVFTRFDKLKCCDTILTSTGFDEIKSVVETTNDKDPLVYDMEVEETRSIPHTYVVNDILTHNTCITASITEKYKPYILEQRKNIMKDLNITDDLLPKIYVVSYEGPKRNFIAEYTSSCIARLYNSDISPYITPEEKLKLDSVNPADEEEQKAIKKIVMRRLTKRKFNGVYKFITYQKLSNDIREGKIKNIDNSLIVFDEAHHIINPKVWNESFFTLIDNSKNFKAIFLSATPVPNENHQIINFINLTCKKEDRIKESDAKKIFDKKDELTEFGESILLEKLHGKVSCILEHDPRFYPRKEYQGEIPKGVDKDNTEQVIKHTMITRCEMSELQMDAYRRARSKNKNITERMSDLLTLVLPPLTDDPNDNYIYKISDIDKIVPAESSRKWREKYGINFYMDNEHCIITGPILSMTNVGKYKYCLKDISTKYYKAIKIILENKGIKYVNSKKINGAGLKTFMEALIVNGFLKFVPFSSFRGGGRKKKLKVEGKKAKEKNADAKAKEEEKSVKMSEQISDNTVCYRCGKRKKDHKESDNNDHEYGPAYVTIVHEAVSDIERNIIVNNLNNLTNMYGARISVILGGKSTSESYNMMRVMTSIKMGPSNNISEDKQIEGRTVRKGGSADMPESDRYVKIYNLAAVEQDADDTLTGDELRYLHNEMKFDNVKIIREIMQKVSFDCYFNQLINPAIVCDIKKTDDEKIDTMYYDNVFFDYEVSRVISYIAYIFSYEFCLTYEQLSKLIDRLDSNAEGLKITDKIKYLAAQTMIKNHTKIINRRGVQGHLFQYGRRHFIFNPDGHDPYMFLALNDRLNYTYGIDDNFEYIIIDQILDNELVKITSNPTDRYGEEFRLMKEKFEKDELELSEKISISERLHDGVISKQIFILETCIKEYLESFINKDDIHPFVVFILETYRSLLLENNEVNKIPDYSHKTTIIKTFKTPTGKEAKKTKEEYSFQKITDLVIGHLLDKIPKLVKNYNDLFSDNIKNNFVVEFDYFRGAIFSNRIDRIRRGRKSDIIGVVDKDKNNRVGFKIIEVNESTNDGRKKKRGFLCNSCSDKSVLLKYAKIIGMPPINKETKKYEICMSMENFLRDKQTNAIREGDETIYFLDLVDYLTIKSQKNIDSELYKKIVQ